MSSIDRNVPAQSTGAAPQTPETIALAANTVQQHGSHPTRRGMLAASLTLAALMLVSTMSPANARGGRTTAADCAAGSDDPDCPDTQDSQNKPPPKDSKDTGAKPDETHK
ncbi:MAG TPA: hypothetical protein VMB73_28790 [Acetobacteraceae bacterium]|jgi:hypothetical protein|nr:hypothetical protein [Acetobacteraceae bacterium]